MAEIPSPPDGFPNAPPPRPNNPGTRVRRQPPVASAQVYMPDRAQPSGISERAIDALNNHARMLERATGGFPDTLSPSRDLVENSTRFGLVTQGSPPQAQQGSHGSPEAPGSQQGNLPPLSTTPAPQPKEVKPDFPGGPKGTDTIPAWLTRGEFVVNAEATKKNLPLLEELNREGTPEMLSGGGQVGTDQPIYRAGGGGFNLRPVSISTIGAAGSGKPEDLLKLFLELAQGLSDGIKDITEGLSKSLGSLGKERIGDAGSSVARGAEQAFHGARGVFGQYNPVLIALENASGFIATVFEATEAFRKLNDQLIRSNISFAEHSAAMTQVEVSMERFRIEMDQVRGARRADTAMAHAESVQRLERSFAKWEDAWANLRGGILTVVNEYLAGILEGINKMVGFAEDNNTIAEGMTKEALDAYREIDWINQFGRLPDNSDSHPRNPRV